MPFDTNGTFSRILNGKATWVGDATAHTPILASRHDTNDNDLADGLSDCLNRRGAGEALADLSMGGHKLINVDQPTQPQDVATKRYVDEMPGWPTHKDISGAGIEGRLNFTSPTGVNGITWTSIDASWVARKANADQAHESDRVVLNNTVNPGDTNAGDVFVIDVDDGSLNFPASHDTRHNLIKDPSPAHNWRTPTAGIGGLWRSAATSLYALANSVVTSAAYNVVSALETWFAVERQGGIVQVTLNKKASGDHTSIYTQMNGDYRWLMQLGNTTAEAAGDVGSEFRLYSCTNAGATKDLVMQVQRQDGKVRFPKGIGGDMVTDGQAIADSNFVSSDTVVILATSGSGGNAHIRPNGVSSGTGEIVVATTGDTTVNGEMTVAGTGNGTHNGIGQQCRTGSTGGGYSSQRGNLAESGGVNPVIYIDNKGYVITGIACDYRIKGEIKPLASTWDKVKALRPVSYQYNGFGGYAADGLERWGFLAHELQESLLPTAATGAMDDEEDTFETTWEPVLDDAGAVIDTVERVRAIGKRPRIQAPELIAVVAALTAALQEAQLRIEALEARP